MLEYQGFKLCPLDVSIVFQGHKNFYIKHFYNKLSLFMDTWTHSTMDTKHRMDTPLMDTGFLNFFVKLTADKRPLMTIQFPKI